MNRMDGDSIGRGASRLPPALAHRDVSRIQNATPIKRANHDRVISPQKNKADRFQWIINGDYWLNPTATKRMADRGVTSNRNGAILSVIS